MSETCLKFLGRTAFQRLIVILVLIFHANSKEVVRIVIKAVDIEPVSLASVKIRIDSNFLEIVPVLINVTPANSVQAIDRYNSATDLFEVTIHYVISGTPWGWFPSFDNQDFLKLDPTRGYVFDSTQEANWTFDPLT